MDKEELKKIIAEIVVNRQGIKAPELVSSVIVKIQDICIENNLDDLSDLPDIINEMVLSKELVEVEYTVPNVEYRVKSFLLPKNSKVLETKKRSSDRQE